MSIIGFFLFFLDKYTAKLYFSNFLMEKTDDMPTYKENEKVLCYHDKLLYEVKYRGEELGF